VWRRGESLIGLLGALQYRTSVRNLIAHQLVLVFFDWATSECQIVGLVASTTAAAKLDVWGMRLIECVPSVGRDD
jgi:hypothetical protein